MLAATCPTCCRSTPLTTSLVCLSTVMLIPGGSGYSIGCEKPSVKTTEFFLASARYPTPKYPVPLRIRRLLLLPHWLQGLGPGRETPSAHRYRPCEWPVVACPWFRIGFLEESG